VDKVVETAALAVADIPDGAAIAFGGFGLCGAPIALINALEERGITRLTTIANNCGAGEEALGVLLYAGRIRKTVSSFVGGNEELARQYLAGQLEVELIPQGTLAERLRAAGVGVPAFFTPTGVGTLHADGGIPMRYAPGGEIAKVSAPREVREFGGREYVLETALHADFACVHGIAGDRHGNVVFEKSAGNFNLVAAMAARTTIAEVERLVEPGELDPNVISLPGIFVDRVVAVSSESKKIERRTTRQRSL